MHMTYAHTSHERTSVESPPRVAERMVAEAAVAAAAARPPAVDLQPLAAMATASERPARVGVGTGERGLQGGRAEGSLRLSAGGSCAHLLTPRRGSYPWDTHQGVEPRCHQQELVARTASGWV